MVLLDVDVKVSIIDEYHFGCVEVKVKATKTFKCLECGNVVREED